MWFRPLFNLLATRAFGARHMFHSQSPLELMMCPLMFTVHIFFVQVWCGISSF